MYSPGIPWHVLNVSTLAEPSQSLSQWLCALQQQDSPAGGWAQGRLRSAGGQVLPPDLRKEHSLSCAQHKTKPNHTKTRASGLQTSHEQVREACGRGLSRGCALVSIQAAPPQCLPLPLPAVCLSRERALSVCLGRECRGGDSSSHPSRALSVVLVPGSLGTVKFPGTWTGWVGRAALQSGLLGNVPPWRNGTQTFYMWPRETPALLNPPFSPSP